MDNNTRYCSVFNQDSSERVIYNNPLFLVSVRYGLLSSYPVYSAVSHWHEDLEFIVIKQGKMTYNVNGELFSLTKDRGIMVNSRSCTMAFPENMKSANLSASCSPRNCYAEIHGFIKV